MDYFDSDTFQSATLISAIFWTNINFVVMSWKRVISEGKFDGPFYNGDLFLDIKKNYDEIRQKAFQIFKYLHLTN